MRTHRTPTLPGFGQVLADPVGHYIARTGPRTVFREPAPDGEGFRLIDRPDVPGGDHGRTVLVETDLRTVEEADALAADYLQHGPPSGHDVVMRMAAEHAAQAA